MSLSTVVNYLKLSLQLNKINIASAMSYPASFWTQVLGLFFNDGARLCIWYIFFKRFPVVAGWGFDQMVILLALLEVVSALCEIPADGIFDLSNYIVTGQLDTYLTMPKNVIWAVAVSHTEIGAIGDGIFGLMLMFLAYGFAPLKILWFLCVAILTASLLFHCVLIIQSFAFWFGDIEDIARRLIRMIKTFFMFPQSIFVGTIKFVMMTILPAFFLVTVPVSLLLDFSWSNLAIFLSSVAVASFGARWFFYKGLERYESGNLTTVRQ